MGVRDRLIRNRTQLANAIHGYAAEFALTAAKGICKIEPLLARIAADETLPELARELFALHGGEYRQVQARLEGNCSPWWAQCRAWRIGRTIVGPWNDD